MKNVWAALFLVGCAATVTPQGPVVSRVDPEQRLCLDRGGLQAGQQLRFKRRVCAYVPPKNLIRTCHDESVETAEVLRVIDDHCVVVVVPADGRIDPGDEIEIAYAK